MTTVYVLFRAVLDPDGFVQWNFVAVARSVPPLEGMVAERIRNHQGKIVSFCPSRMTDLNNYTVIGDTKDVQSGVEHLSQDVLGFVIQSTTLL